MIGSLLQDIRYAWRQLRTNRGFTFVAVLTLALGIGANTAIFSVINEHLLRPLPYNEPERIVALWDTNKKGPDGNREQVTYLNYLDWRHQNRVFEEMAAFAYGNANYSGEGEPARVNGLVVTEGYFRVLGMRPLLGRTFTPEECAAEQEGVVVLGHSFWQKQFGGRPDILGRTIRLNGYPHSVVGVMPPECSGLFVFFGYQYAPELWTPLTPKPWQAYRGNHSWFAIARLKPGIRLESAQADMKVISSRLARQYPEANKDWEAQVGDFQETIFGSTRPVLLSLLGAVGVVLLIACINVANLLLCRASHREKEVAIRTAVGATRPRLVRHMLTESLMLSLIGGGAGLLLAFWIVGALNSSLPGDRFVLHKIQLDHRVVIFGFLVSLLTTVMVGLIPALRASRLDLNETLKETGKATALAPGRHRLSKIFVVGEVSLSLVLLISAGLLVKTFTELWKVDLGFRSDKLLTMFVVLSDSRYPEEGARIAFFKDLLARVDSLPGVAASGITGRLPLDGSPGTIFRVEGQAVPKAGEWPAAGYLMISPDYFKALRIPLQRGRYFSGTDHEKAESVVIISSSLARRYWPGADPIGKHVWQAAKGKGEWCAVVGVVPDLRQDGLEKESRPIIYLPYPQAASPFMSLVVRTEGEPLSLAGAIRKEVATLDPDQPVFDVKTMDAAISNYLGGRRLVLALMTCFALVALLLAVIGIYGVISYSVLERTREIGIRLALGACRAEVVKMVVGQGFMLIACGVALGLVISAGVTGLLASQLHGVSPTDPWTFGAVVVILVAVSLIACYLPARRATRIEPPAALRWE